GGDAHSGVEDNAARDAAGKPVGYVILRDGWQWSDERALCVVALAVTDGTSLRRVLPSVLRGLKAMVPTLPSRMAVDPLRLLFLLGRDHPVYSALDHDLVVPARRPYAWYVRVPDLVGFVGRIAPPLEKRLAGSAQAGYTGELKVSFYREGLLFRFREGRVSVEGWKPERVEDGDAAFPDLTFLKMLFGYRSLEELQHAFPDCWASTDAARALLPILFPGKGSHVWVGG
ncbi:MAG: hypothetical protein ACJ78Q_04115, partial [Chloroflexia bacterium]